MKIIFKTKVLLVLHTLQDSKHLIRGTGLYWVNIENNKKEYGILKRYKKLLWYKSLFKLIMNNYYDIENNYKKYTNN